MRKRIDQLGVAEPEIQRTGDNQIRVALPGGQRTSPTRSSRSARSPSSRFYDWEVNVIGPERQARAREPERHRRQARPARSARSRSTTRVLRAVQAPGEGRAEQLARGQPLLRRRREDQDGLRQGHRQATSATARRPRPRRSRDGARRRCARRRKVYEVKPNTVIVRAEQAADAKEKTDAWFVLQDDVALQGKEIKNPEQQFDQGAGGDGSPNVTFEFTDKGRKIWQDVTREIADRGSRSVGILPGQTPADANQHFAIVLDDELISIPYIDFRKNADGIDGRTGSQISGGFTIKSAQELANLLKTGALPLKLDLIANSQVSATLGQQALNQGLLAGIAGFIIVALFLLIFYRVLGVIAVVAMAIYALYFFALIKLIPVTLTLPGIAGLILTLGVAADANIVIFERVKEEIRGGRSVMAGIATGYKKGLTAIIDANVVTIMVAFILFVLATAGVKGFALTLGLGVIVSLFTAVLATQAILGTMGKSRLINSPSALGAGEKKGQPLPAGLHGLLEVVLQRVRRDPARLRARARRQGHQLRHRLRVRHADQRRADAERRRRRRARRAGATTARATRRSRRSRTRARARASSRSRRRTSAPGEVDEDHRRARGEVRLRRHAGVDVDRADVRPDGREVGDHRDHRVAARDQRLHRAALRAEVRRPGADRGHARHPHHRGRLRARSARR